MKTFLEVERNKCELEGPFECPSCQGHAMFDSTYLEQVSSEVACPYCQEKMDVPEYTFQADMPIREKIKLPSGSISVSEHPDPTCPGYYVSINEEPLVLVEHDGENDEYAVRVWSHDAPYGDYIYKQSVPNDFAKEEEEMTKKYELTYYGKTGSTDPIDDLDTVKEILFNEMGGEYPFKTLNEGDFFVNTEGELIQFTSFDDGEPDEDGFHVQEDSAESVRFGLEYVDVSDIHFEAESFAYGETFMEAVEDLFHCIRIRKELPGTDTDELSQNYYYTNEDDGYRFYTEADLEPEEEDE